jgi:glucokinase
VRADIGGTHARFAIAEVENGCVVSLGEPATLKTAEHASLQTAYQAFEAGLGHPLPRAGRYIDDYLQQEGANAPKVQSGDMTA